MSTLASLLHTPLFESIGWSLIHLTWQATIVALLLAATVTTFRPRSAATRYLLSVIALSLIAVLPIITGLQHYSSVKSTDPAGSAVAATAPLMSATTQSLTVTSLGRAALRDVVNGFKSDLYLLLTAAVPYLLILWFLGVALFSIRLAAAWMQARQLTRDGLAPAPAFCVAALDRISTALGLQRSVRLFVSELVEVPSVIGYLRPMILLPVSCLSGLTVEQLESVIAHELAHVRRYDFVVNFGQTVVETLFFFHPAVWWISAQVRAERENACDDLAVEVCGDARVYANALTLLEQMRPQFATVSVAATGGNLLSRIKRLLKIDAPAEQFSTRWFAGLTLAAVAAIMILVLPFGLAAQANKVLPNTERGGRSEAPKHAGTTVDVIASEDHESAEEDRNGELTPEVEAAREEHDENEISFEFDSAAIEQRAQMAVAAADHTQHYFRFAELDLGHVSSEVPCPETLRREADAAQAAKLAGKAHEMSVKHLTKFREEVRFDLAELDETHLAALARAGVERGLVESLANIGCGDVSVRELRTLRDVGVTAAYVKSIHSAVEEIESIEQLKQLKSLGVDATYARAFRAAGFSVPSDAIASAKALGVTPEFARDMRRRLNVEDVEELGQLRAVGVTTQYVKDLRSLGFSDFDVDDIAGARAMGVTKPFVVALRTAGLGEISLSDAVELRAAGVTPADVKTYRRLHGEQPSADDVIEEKHRGLATELSELDGKRFTLSRQVEEARRELERERRRREKPTRSR